MHLLIRFLIQKIQNKFRRTPAFRVHIVMQGGMMQSHLTSLYTVNKEIKCSGDSEILHEIVRDITRKSEKHEPNRVISRTISCSISESPRYT